MTFRPRNPVPGRPDDDRIRPLAPDAGEDEFKERPRPGPLVAVVAAIGLLILVGLVGLGTPPTDQEPAREGAGPLASGEAEITTTTTTTTTLPPVLGEYAPLEAPMFVVPDERDTLMYSWHPSAREQQWVALSSFPRHIDFDATGRWLAYLPTDDLDGVGDLWVGLGNGSQWAQWPATTSAVWHPEFESNLAWAGDGTDNEGSYGIRIGGVDGRTGRLVEAQFFLPLEQGMCLTAWGQWGFATQPCDGTPRLDIHSPPGDLIATGPVSLISASASGRFLVLDDASAFSVLNRELEVVTGLTLEPEADLRLTSDGTQVLEVLQIGDRTRVRSLFVDRPGGRSVSVAERAVLIDLSSDEQFAVLHMPDSGDLVLVDWEAGPTFRIPGGWPRVAAVFVP